MESLDQLTLNHNKLEHLGAGFFRGLNSLTTLYADHNQIQTINKEAFEGLEDSLTSLTLTGNQIGEFPMLALRRIHRLQTLHLDDNKVSYSWAGTKSAGFDAQNGLDLTMFPGLAFRAQPNKWSLGCMKLPPGSPEIHAT